VSSNAATAQSGGGDQHRGKHGRIGIGQATPIRAGHQSEPHQLRYLRMHRLRDHASLFDFINDPRPITCGFHRHRRAEGNSLQILSPLTPQPGTRRRSISGLVTPDTPSVTRTSENRVVVSSCAAVTEKLGTDSGKFPAFGERERNGGVSGAAEGENGRTSFPALADRPAGRLRETA